jgi:hypothetical protein
MKRSPSKDAGQLRSGAREAGGTNEVGERKANIVEKGAAGTGVVLFGLLLAILMSSMDNTIVATAMGTIVGEMGGLDNDGGNGGYADFRQAVGYVRAQTVLYFRHHRLYGRVCVVRYG